MKGFLKKFPLMSYSVTVVLMAFFLMKDVPYDSNILVTLVNFLIIFLGLPLIGIGQIYTLLGIKASLPWVIPIFFLLDLLILYLRKCLIPSIRGKNKSLLIPKLNLSSHRLPSGLFSRILKVLSKSRNKKS